MKRCVSAPQAPRLNWKINSLKATSFPFCRPPQPCSLLLLWEKNQNKNSYLGDRQWRDHIAKYFKNFPLRMDAKITLEPDDYG